MRRRALRLGVGAAALAAFLVVLAHPAALAGSDLWSNVAPASPLGSGGLFNRYPLDHYSLDQHFDAVSASLTGGVDVSGVPPMIAYFLASILWALTSFLANSLISLFSFAFSLDLVNGSAATGGAGALAPVSRAIHEIYDNVFGQPWLVLAFAIVGIWAMWKALVQRRYSETAGALALSLIYIVVALFFVAQPGTTIGTASKLTNQMSGAFLSIADHGEPGGEAQAKDAAANQLFELLVYKPWVVLEFGGLEHCAVDGTGDEDSDPESAPVRPLSSSPQRDAELGRRLAGGTEVAADGKTCVNNANKYGDHFLHFGLGSDERDAEYDALNHGDVEKLPDADRERADYRLGVADKPATDAMEEGGQYQRLLIAIVVFVGELGAFLVLGSLSIGVILAQVLLLLLLAFAPVALVAAAIPGRGHDFFKSWLEKLAGYLLRKAAYSLILATLLAVNGALASATSELGWLMSFGLQALFFWAVFVQRKTLTEGLVGIATGPRAPGREASLRVLALYAGAGAAGRALRPVRRGARAAAAAPRRVFRGGSPGRRGAGSGSSTATTGGREAASPKRDAAVGPQRPSHPNESSQTPRSRNAKASSPSGDASQSRKTGAVSGRGRTAGDRRGDSTGLLRGKTVGKAPKRTAPKGSEADDKKTTASAKVDGGGTTRPARRRPAGGGGAAKPSATKPRRTAKPDLGDELRREHSALRRSRKPRANGGERDAGAPRSQAPGRERKGPDR